MPANRKDSIKYASNPFLEEASQLSKTKHKPILTKQDKNGSSMAFVLGDNVVPAGFYAIREVEANEFVKIYTWGIGQIMGLSTAGKKVFMLIVQLLSGKEGAGKTEVALSYTALKKLAQNHGGSFMSSGTFYKGVNECIQKGIIAESYIQSTYFVNINYIFNGKRLAIINEYRLKQMHNPAQPTFETTLEEHGQQRLIDEPSLP